jgi:hypothetical protein
LRRSVIKIAIDKRTGESENRGHEENLARGLPAPGWLRSEEAAGCGNPAADTERGTARHCRNHPILRGRKAGEWQHCDLQLSARDYLDRFKNGPHHSGLQEDERREMRLQKYPPFTDRS